MVATLIAPIGNDVLSERSRAPVWVRGIAERNKLTRTPSDLEHHDEAYQRSLIMRLGHADPSSRIVAAQCLATVAPRASRAALDALLCRRGQLINRSGGAVPPAGARGVMDSSTQVQAACIESAGIIAQGSGDVSVCYILIEMLKSRDWTVRSAATKALAMVCTRESRGLVIDELCTLLEDGEWFSKMSAADAMAVLACDVGAAGPRVVGALARALENKDWAVRKSSTVAMTKVVSGEIALPFLLARANDRDWRVRKAVLEQIAMAYRPGSELAVEEAVMSRLEDASVTATRGEYDEAALCDHDVKIAAITCLCSLSVHGQQWVRSALEGLQGAALPPKIRQLVEASCANFPNVVHAEYF